MRSGAEVEDVAVGAEAAEDGGAWCGGHGEAQMTDGDGAVVGDAHAEALTPDGGPPGAGRGGAQVGALVGHSLVPGGWGRGAQFAVDFMGVGVGQERVEEAVGSVEFVDAVGGQQRREAFLPVVVAAFDFALGLGRGGVAQGDAVEVEGGTEPGEGVGGVGGEEGVVVHGEGQGQAVGLEGAGEEVEVGQEGFAGVEAGAGVETGGVVEEIEPALLVGGAGEEGVRGGVVWPEGTEVAGLPALDGLGRLFGAGVGGEIVFEGPAADAGAVGFAVEAAEQFAGAGAGGGGRLGGEQRGELGEDRGGPVGVVVAAGSLGCPGVGAALGAGEQVVGAPWVEAAGMNVQFEGRRLGREVSGTDFGEEVADQRGGQTRGEWLFFMGRKGGRRNGFYAWQLTPAGKPGRHGGDGPASRWSDFRRRSGCVPAEPYPPLKCL